MAGTSRQPDHTLAVLGAHNHSTPREQDLVGRQRTYCACLDGAMSGAARRRVFDAGRGTLSLDKRGSIRSPLSSTKVQRAAFPQLSSIPPPVIMYAFRNRYVHIGLGPLSTAMPQFRIYIYDGIRNGVFTPISSTSNGPGSEQEFVVHLVDRPHEETDALLFNCGRDICIDRGGYRSARTGAVSHRFGRRDFLRQVVSIISTCAGLQERQRQSLWRRFLERMRENLAASYAACMRARHRFPVLESGHKCFEFAKLPTPELPPIRFYSRDRFWSMWWNWPMHRKRGRKTRMRRKRQMKRMRQMRRRGNEGHR